MTESLERIDIFGIRPNTWYTEAKWQPLVDAFDDWDNLFFFYLEDGDSYPSRIDDVTENLVGLLHDFRFDPMPVWEAYLAISSLNPAHDASPFPQGRQLTIAQVANAYHRAQLVYALVLRKGVTTERPSSRARKRKGRRADAVVAARRELVRTMKKDGEKTAYIVGILEKNNFPTNTDLVRKDVSWLRQNGKL